MLITDPRSVYCGYFIAELQYRHERFDQERHKISRPKKYLEIEI